MRARVEKRSVLGWNKSNITPSVVADCHGVKWYDSEDVIDLDEVPSLQWKFSHQFGNAVFPNSSVWMSRFDAWLMMYGKKTFPSFFDNNNLELLRRGRNPFKDMVKVLRFQGVVRFAFRFEFRKRDELWSTVGRKYISAVEFGKTGMGRDIFKEIFSAQRYSEQPPSRPSNLSSEQYQCMPVDDHISNFNKNRARNYHPSDSICVDEFMSR